MPLLHTHRAQLLPPHADLVWVDIMEIHSSHNYNTGNSCRGAAAAVFVIVVRARWTPKQDRREEDGGTRVLCLSCPRRIIQGTRKMQGPRRPILA